MLIAALILLLLVGWELHLQRSLGKAACIRARRTGWVVIEVRRRVSMQRLPQHVSEFPVPREERILVSRLLGIVLWHREMSVALPEAACGHLAEITPQDFDRQFPSWLRLANGPG
ncbi:hypothetical protein QTH90_05895 [Variovorax sp. J2P1-59]|uniref:hypothetical protein n=1 Tax=Variovorax flavidus TaxID=3053501 RepID=UPI002574EDC0|nr:hypothetical protein [Variovorax sp. J2P1-59]MDM0073904.1 hypothetical protein [Variovorax sp. J2P1-59]